MSAWVALATFVAHQEHSAEDNCQDYKGADVKTENSAVEQNKEQDDNPKDVTASHLATLAVTSAKATFKEFVEHSVSSCYRFLYM